jgi:hypothetical protein
MKALDRTGTVRHRDRTVGKGEVDEKPFLFLGLVPLLCVSVQGQQRDLGTHRCETV